MNKRILVVILGVIIFITVAIALTITSKPRKQTADNNTAVNVQAKPSKIINSFEECKNDGNPVVESDPRQCRVDGKLFVDDVGPRRDCQKTSCPSYTPPPQGWCPNGKELSPLKDKCGCDGPPRCEKNQ